VQYITVQYSTVQRNRNGREAKWLTAFTWDSGVIKRFLCKVGSGNEEMVLLIILRNKNSLSLRKQIEETLQVTFPLCPIHCALCLISCAPCPVPYLFLCPVPVPTTTEPNGGASDRGNHLMKNMIPLFRVQAEHDRPEFTKNKRQRHQKLCHSILENP
jgi:hypothetical protein